MEDDPPGAADQTLDGAVRAGDPDRWLASRLIADPAARADVVALLAYDLELARAPRRASNPLIGEIRLTWWREALEEIYGDRPVRRHPTAQALAEVVTRHGLPRASLEAMIDARYVELDRRPLTDAEATVWAADSAGAVAKLAALILAPAADPAPAQAAARAWALAQAARSGQLEATCAAPLVAAALAEHRRAAPLPVAAFPAAAAGALAQKLLRAGAMSDLEKRARLLWASLRGRV
jgi:phytoene synthase